MWLVRWMDEWMQCKFEIVFVASQMYGWMDGWIV